MRQVGQRVEQRRARSPDEQQLLPAAAALVEVGDDRPGEVGRTVEAPAHVVAGAQPG